MNADGHREAAKRRIMFVPGEDFYFLGYTAMVLLTEMDCTSDEKPLIDSRKIAYVADLIGGDADLRLALTTAELGHAARSRLSLLYDRAVARRAPLERLVEALARRGLVAITRGAGDPDRIHLVQSSDTHMLLDSPLYEAERLRIKILRRSLTQLRTMTLATVKARLFGSHGVRTWGE